MYLTKWVSRKMRTRSIGQAKQKSSQRFKKIILCSLMIS